MRVLVTGGAGYIGSHTVVHLAAAGHEPVIVDNLGNSRIAVMDRLKALTGVEIAIHRFDLRDAVMLDRVFTSERFDAVIHIAGLKSVGESVDVPLRYYQNNLGSTLVLLEAMQRHGLRSLVFSSSATVYGADASTPMTEDAPTSAVNPYGWTKVMIEQVLRDAAAAQPQVAVAVLRYFNPVGAHPSGLIGEDPLGVPSNLVPTLAQVAVGRRKQLQVFGTDYPTPDGTCVRDYIHVEDVAAGHVAALDQIHGGTGVHTWNLGTGRGVSVFEMLHAFEGAALKRLPWEAVARRPGDIAVSYADVARAQAELGWTASRTIEQMCGDAWRWQSQNPTGYPEL